VLQLRAPLLSQPNGTFYHIVHSHYLNYRNLLHYYTFFVRRNTLPFHWKTHLRSVIFQFWFTICIEVSDILHKLKNVCYYSSSLSPALVWTQHQGDGCTRASLLVAHSLCALHPTSLKVYNRLKYSFWPFCKTARDIQSHVSSRPAPEWWWCVWAYMRVCACTCVCVRACLCVCVQKTWEGMWRSEKAQ